MKIKEIEKTANVAWSPKVQFPIYLATGTAAQQLDATFSTSSALEIYRFNPETEGLECELEGSTETDHRFNKVVWGNGGMAAGEHASGLIVGGTDNGAVCVWDASKIIMNESDSMIHKLEKHTGSVGALDFNTFQENLLASGGGESEILLWDLNNPGTPMTPGAKSAPADDVTCLAWNKQVQHILASALNNRCVVWDLRKNEPIIKISDSMSRIRSKLVAWHPQVATQLVLASEDDHTPIVQLWDLRFAASPVKLFEKHQRGILSMAWSAEDSDLLLTCGKDNRLLCWNPNSDVAGGEVIYDMPIGSQWCFDVQWCPRNPHCVSACSFDGHISMYSLNGGEMVTQPAAASNKIADSFGGFDAATAPQNAPKAEKIIVPQMTKAPNWLKRPCGASFGFGGKLVTFSNEKPKDLSQGKVTNQVSVHQVVTEDSLVAKSSQLEHAIHNRQYTEYCSLKIANNVENKDELIWNFLKVNFESEPRSRYLHILGFDKQEISQRVRHITGDNSNTELDQDSLSTKLGTMSAGDAKEAESDFDVIGQQQQQQSEEGDDFAQQGSMKINSKDGDEGLLTQALLTGNFEVAVDLCFHNNRLADAIILANADGPDLLRKTMKRYFASSQGTTSQLISAVVQKDYANVVQTIELENWKEALAVILTYTKPEEFASFCDELGARLESSPDDNLSSNAILCYICSGNIDKFVDCWISQTPNSNDPSSLQDLVEKVMMLRKAVEQVQGREYMAPSTGSLADKLGNYAELLAAEGSLATALTYLSGSTESVTLNTLKYRLQVALGQTPHHTPWPQQPVQQPKQQQSSARQQPNRQPAGNYNQMYNSSQPQSYGQQVPANQHYSSTARSTLGQPSVNGTAYTTTTASNYNSYNAQTSYGQSPYTQPAQTTYTNQPVSTYQPQASVSQQNYQPQQPSQYGAQQNYTGYGQQQPQQANPGHVASRGLLGKKYSSGPASSAPATSTPAPQSYYNPASMVPSAPEVSNTHQMYSPTSAAAPVYQQQHQYTLPPAEAPTGPSGWNDPPPVHGKKTETKAAAVPTPKAAPITQPVFNPTPVPPTSSMQYGQQYNPAGQQYNQAQQQYNQGPQQYNQAQQYNQQYVGQQSPTGTSMAMEQPPAPVQKGPIPDKHKVLQEVFDTLAKKCLETTRNAQQKRKLEDVLRKLEFLYDKLRAEVLGDSILAGLHQIVEAIKQYDYQNGLGIHTYMVSQGNFSEISAFMPGIKMLMQTAGQLNIFV